MRTITILLITLSVTAATLQDLASGNNNFASSVYAILANRTDDNILVSPLSAYLILSLTQHGARNSTAEEIQQALQLPSYCNEAVRSLLENLVQDPNYILQIVNKVYVKENYVINQDFADVARLTYGADAENLDFSCRNRAAGIINDWVEAQTDNKITGLIDPQILGNETRAVLVNALRFRANWTKPFQYFATIKKDFYSYDSVVTLDTLHNYDEEYDFYEKPHLNATFLLLPLEGENVTMTIALPNDKDGLFLLEEHIEEVLEAPEVVSREMFNVGLPQFKIEARIDFKSVLQNLGVRKAFREGEADFTKIAGEKGELFIDDVVQKTYMEIDRNGIDSAVATYIVKIVNRNAEYSRDFYADHPFIFFVKVKDVIVFLGRLVLP